jgi:hypothetical protein
MGDHCPSSPIPVAGGLPLLLQAKEGTIYMRAALFPYVWRHGEQCHGVDGRPGESSPVGASWCVLCSYRSGLEGGGVVVGRLAAVV